MRTPFFQFALQGVRAEARCRRLQEAVENALDIRRGAEAPGEQLQALRAVMARNAKL